MKNCRDDHVDRTLVQEWHDELHEVATKMGKHLDEMRYGAVPSAAQRAHNSLTVDRMTKAAEAAQKEEEIPQVASPSASTDKTQEVSGSMQGPDKPARAPEAAAPDRKLSEQSAGDAGIPDGAEQPCPPAQARESRGATTYQRRPAVPGAPNAPCFICRWATGMRLEAGDGFAPICSDACEDKFNASKATHRSSEACPRCHGMGVLPNVMDGEDGPVCACGKPSRRESGYCGGGHGPIKCSCSSEASPEINNAREALRTLRQRNVLTFAEYAALADVINPTLKRHDKNGTVEHLDSRHGLASQQQPAIGREPDGGGLRPSAQSEGPHGDQGDDHVRRGGGRVERRPDGGREALGQVDDDSDGLTFLDRAEFLLITLEAVDPVVENPQCASMLRGAINQLRKQCASERQRTQDPLTEGMRQIGKLGADVLSARCVDLAAALEEAQDLLGATLGYLDSGGELIKEVRAWLAKQRVETPVNDSGEL